MKELKKYSNVILMYNKYFYKEIELSEFHSKKVILGNDENSNIRLKLDCLHNVSVEFECINNFWQIQHSDEVYLVINGVKVRRKILSNGDKIKVKSTLNDQEIFKINYFIDFEGQKETYDKIIHLQDMNQIKIGRGKSNDIIIDDELVDREHCLIYLGGNSEYFIKDVKSKFGVFVNGIKVDDSKKLKDNDFIIICGYKFLYRYKALILSSIHQNISTNNLKIYKNESENEILDYPSFIRSPRLISKLPDEEIKIQGVPSEEKKPSMAFLRSLATMVGMVVISYMFMSGTENGMSFRYYMIGMMAVSFIVSVVVYICDRKKYNKKKVLREQRYREYIEENDKKIKLACEKQAEIIRENNPEEATCIRFLDLFDRRIWERQKDHDDFLSVAIGRGYVKPCFNISIPAKTFEIERDPLNDLSEELKKKYERINNVPIEINLKENSSIGIIGKREDTLNLTRDILIKLTTEHFYKDLKIVLIFPEEEINEWKWTRWLPHIWSENREVRYMAYNKEYAKNILNYLYTLIVGEKNSCHYIFIIADRTLVENQAIMTELEKKEKDGVSVIYVYEHLELIPEECTKVINLLDSKQGEIISTDNAKDSINFVYTTVDNYTCERFSKRMSPIYVKTSFEQNSLPNHYTLFDLYNIRSTSQIDIMQNWNSNEIYKTMEAPIGINISGEIVSLNIHEKFHGPHGLVAGTTGSGKSEILQTYIASLALNYHPYDLAIIIIDYKGGGMANLFKDLPHLVGTITNLDGNQINRSLICIKSELKRRQQIFSEYNVNHIDSYIKLYKEGKAKKPIPHLLLIADEFAELKADQPEFMKELVSAARIGRSLGVHLILATQKPSGVVDDQIWSNSKFRLCLKVQTVSDSNEMIKSPLAAEIVEPGRAYMQVGNNEIFQLFQSAWSGAKDFGDDVHTKEIEIAEIAVDGYRNVLYSTKDDRDEESFGTQLDSVIEETKNICMKYGIKKLPGPWLPPLKDIIYLQEICDDFIDEDIIDLNRNILIEPTIGIVDKPELQSQTKLKLRLSEDGNAMIVGAPTTGKTTMLQTIITSMLLSYTPSDVNIYILDFGARILKIFEKAPHVGGVITSDAEEYLINFFKMINKEVARRKDLFSEEGVASLYSYKEATKKVLPQIVIILDNFAAFNELYPNLYDNLVGLSRDGANLGISLVITVSNITSVRYKLANNFKIAMSLYLADKADYSNVLGARINILPADIKGRGLIKEDGVNEFQVALPTEGESESIRSKEIKKIIDKLNYRYKNLSAVPIPIIPKVLLLKDVKKDMERNLLYKEAICPIGLNTNSLEYSYTDMNRNLIWTVIGKSQTGKTNTIKVFINSLLNYNTEINICSKNDFIFKEFTNNKKVSKIVTTKDEILELFAELEKEIITRKTYVDDEIVKYNGSKLQDEIVRTLTKKVYVIDDIGDLLKKTNNNATLLNTLVKIITEYKELNIVLIIGGNEEVFSGNMYTLDLMKRLKQDSVSISTISVSSIKFYDVNLPYGTKESPMKKGDGYFIGNNGFYRVKLPLFDPN